MKSQYPLEQQGGHIGATISDIDLNNLDQGAVSFIHETLREHLVVFFRNQSLSPARLLELANLLGTPTPYPFVQGIEGFPEIVEVKKAPEDTVNFGGVWHSDTTYLKQPAMGALLYGIDIPDTGGDTLFANMYKVLSSLSPGLMAFLKPLFAVNEADKEAIVATRPGKQKKGLVAEHPVIRTHPETGQPLLYVNRAHTTRFVGMTAPESQPILNYLFEQTERPEFSCRFTWQPGSLAFWDNRACQHYPLNDYPGELRRMLRVSLSGDKPFK